MCLIDAIKMYVAERIGKKRQRLAAGTAFTFICGLVY